MLSNKQQNNITKHNWKQNFTFFFATKQSYIAHKTQLSSIMHDNEVAKVKIKYKISVIAWQFPHVNHKTEFQIVKIDQKCRASIVSYL